MKKFLVVFSLLFVLFLGGCSISVDFDGAIMDRFVNKISYLYANCWSDIEGLQEVMTPESIQNMDQTCVASIKAITKIKSRLEKMRGKIGNSEIVSNLLFKVNELLGSLETSKNQILDSYNLGTLPGSFDNILNGMKNDEEVSDWLGN